MLVEREKKVEMEKGAAGGRSRRTRSQEISFETIKICAEGQNRLVVCFLVALSCN